VALLINTNTNNNDNDNNNNNDINLHCVSKKPDCYDLYDIPSSIHDIYYFWHRETLFNSRFTKLKSF